MTQTMQKNVSDFDRAAEKMGVVKDGGIRLPFLDLRAKSGNWVTGTVIGEREITFKPKRGKNKGKLQTSTLYEILVETSNIPGVESGESYALSVDGGLLGWQFENRPKECTAYPFPVAIRYSGKDDEGRHQTEVRFPKAEGKK